MILNVAVAVCLPKGIFVGDDCIRCVQCGAASALPVSGISPLWNELSHQVAPSRPKYGTGLGQTEEEK
jgi:hypothetical protein